ncbi:indole-3-glycerol phosphate synthase TrpC [Nonlabens xiamenensis]|uniref:indole-3-glycerol phosphate synthase TrpC n=1 Tax=Nonlabens xiamenensis TaxID=2341043 RepID=UPI000F6109B6|nr:indole-3-glycerol phosphate synthase TrpC [Nonlabens xiamenensis]
MADILKKIVDHTTQNLRKRKQEMPLQKLREMLFYSTPCLSLHKALEDGSGIIAEHKRQSPSKGSFDCPASLIEIVTGYEKAGASAISCLTNQHFFGGTLDDLRDVKKHINIPVLRKDFMVDLYQVHEAKAYGADAILLIAACLDKEQMQALALESLNLGLDILFEVHHEDELDTVKKLSAQFPKNKYIIGVNNRDLKRFKTDIQVSKDLFPHFPDGVLAISESGISDPETVKELQLVGYTGFLMGEAFMKTDDPGRSCDEFIKAIRS